MVFYFINAQEMFSADTTAGNQPYPVRLTLTSAGSAGSKATAESLRSLSPSHSSTGTELRSAHAEKKMPVKDVLSAAVNEPETKNSTGKSSEKLLDLPLNFEQMNAEPALTAQDKSTGSLNATNALSQTQADSGRHLRSSYINEVLRQVEAKKFYPILEKEKGHEGEVSLSVTLRADGELVSVAVAKASPYKRLDSAALDAVKRAAPFPAFPAEVAEDIMDISFIMAFQLM